MGITEKTAAFRAARAKLIEAARHVRATMPGADVDETEGGYPEGLPPFFDLVDLLEAWDDPAWDARAPMSTPMRAAAPTPDEA